MDIMIDSNDGKAENATDEAASESDPLRVLDCLPLIQEATELKDKGNAHVKKKLFSEAVKVYEEGIAVLSRCDGRRVLQDEKGKTDSLRAALHANIAQCMLNLQLYRRAIEACTECLKFDEHNAKALHRRSQAYESLREYEDALKDLLSLRKIGGGGLDLTELETRCEKMLERTMKVNKQVNKIATDNAELFQMKERFEAVLEKYDLGDGHVAPEVARWVVEDNNVKQTIQRAAKRWDMSIEEAGHFVQWIAKGLEMKIIPDPRTVPGAGSSPQPAPQ